MIYNGCFPSDRPELSLTLFKNWRHRVGPVNDGQHIENVSKVKKN